MNMRQAGPLAGIALFGMLAVTSAAPPQVLRIGTGADLVTDSSAEKEEAGRDTLGKFIHKETGLSNEITTEPNYRQLAEKLNAGQLHVGVFLGHQFAWARERYPRLQALAVAVNGYPSRYLHVVSRSDSKAANFAGLAGQALALPRISQGYSELFIDRQSALQGKEAADFFERITHPENFEIALDDVVDGVVQTAVVDRVALDAYKRRKPGRFSQLKEVARSAALPSSVIAVREAGLDADTMARFRDGLVNARKKTEGQRLLTLFRLTSFELPPKDFERLLAETRKAYPPAP